MSWVLLALPCFDSNVIFCAVCCSCTGGVLFAMDWVSISWGLAIKYYDEIDPNQMETSAGSNVENEYGKQSKELKRLASM